LDAGRPTDGRNSLPNHHIRDYRFPMGEDAGQPQLT
jgi:hypothetical protein